MDEKTEDKENGGTEHKRKNWINAHEGEERPGGKGPQHKELPMGHIEDPGNTVLKAETHSNEGIDAPHEKAPYYDIQKFDKHPLVLLPLSLRLAACPDGRHGLRVTVSHCRAYFVFLGHS